MNLGGVMHDSAAAACRETVLRAAAAVDTGDARGLADLFTEDAVLLRPNGEALHGRAAIFDAYANRPAGRITRHLVTGTWVDLLAGGQARATSFVLLWSGDAARPQSPSGRPADKQVVGEFHDLLVHTATGWRIARRDARFILHAT
jgi:ketosteroid isomerase-like protein